MAAPKKEVDTESRILDAAHRVFLREGTSGARMQEIANEAGVNKALLHYYFQNKQRLADAVFLRVVRNLFPAVQQIFESDQPFEDKVRAFVASEFDTMDANPYMPGYVISELQQQPGRIKALLESSGPPPLDAIQGSLDKEIAAGRYHPITAADFFLTALSLILYPYAARPVVTMLTEMNGESLDAMFARRREMTAEWLLRMVRKSSSEP